MRGQSSLEGLTDDSYISIANLLSERTCRYETTELEQSSSIHTTTSVELHSTSEQEPVRDEMTEFRNEDAPEVVVADVEQAEISSTFVTEESFQLAEEAEPEVVDAPVVTEFIDIVPEGP